MPADANRLTPNCLTPGITVNAAATETIAPMTTQTRRVTSSRVASLRAVRSSGWSIFNRERRRLISASTVVVIAQPIAPTVRTLESTDSVPRMTGGRSMSSGRKGGPAPHATANNANTTGGRKRFIQRVLCLNVSCGAIGLAFFLFDLRLRSQSGSRWSTASGQLSHQDGF